MFLFYPFYVFRCGVHTRVQMCIQACVHRCIHVCECMQGLKLMCEIMPHHFSIYRGRISQLKPELMLYTEGTYRPVYCGYPVSLFGSCDHRWLPHPLGIYRHF